MVVSGILLNQPVLTPPAFPATTRPASSLSSVLNAPTTLQQPDAVATKGQAPASQRGAEAEAKGRPPREEKEEASAGTKKGTRQLPARLAGKPAPPATDEGGEDNQVGDCRTAEVRPGSISSANVFEMKKEYGGKPFLLRSAHSSC